MKIMTRKSCNYGECESLEHLFLSLIITNRTHCIVSSKWPYVTLLLDNYKLQYTVRQLSNRCLDVVVIVQGSHCLLLPQSNMFAHAQIPKLTQMGL